MEIGQCLLFSTTYADSESPSMAADGVWNLRLRRSKRCLLGQEYKTGLLLPSGLEPQALVVTVPHL